MPTRAEPAAQITAETASQLAARVYSVDAVAKRAARDELRQRMLGVLIEVADDVEHPRRDSAADRVLDRLDGRPTQTVAGDPSRPQVLQIVTGVNRGDDAAD